MCRPVELYVGYVRDEHVGNAFGPYRLEQRLGTGGLGTVHLAKDVRTEQSVALKILPALADVERDAFRRTMGRVAGIESANVLPVYDYGEVDGRPYLTMPIVPGEELAAVLRRDGPLPLAPTVEIIFQVADAVEAIHRAGMVHRDIKPSNILISWDQSRLHAYLIDFGLATFVTEPGTNDDTGFVGTPRYMAPERFADPDNAGTASDLYSLGCVLFELLTGAAPFAELDTVALIYAHLSQPPPRPSDHRPGLPAEFDDVVRRLMAKNPDDRPSVRDLRAGLAEAGSRPAVGSATAPTGDRPDGERSTRPWTRRIGQLVRGAATVLDIAGGPRRRAPAEYWDTAVAYLRDVEEHDRGRSR